jgi:Protein of unknown function (DUF3152)
VSSVAPPGNDEDAPAGIPARRQRIGLVALASGFVVLGLLVAGARGLGTPVPGAPKAAVSAAASYAPDPPIPSAALTSVYASGQKASGQYVTSTITAAPMMKATKTNPYTVRVETSLNTDPDAVARVVQATLDDPRGWASFGKNNFSLVAADAPGQLVVVVASPETVDSLCGASTTKGTWDCRAGSTIVLNSDRWLYMTPTYTSLSDFRAFMINHEIGVYLGQAETACKSKGAKAPVMADQGRTLGGCAANPWPKP